MDIDSLDLLGQLTHLHPTHKVTNLKLIKQIWDLMIYVSYQGKNVEILVEDMDNNDPALSRAKDEKLFQKKYKQIKLNKPKKKNSEPRSR